MRCPNCGQIIGDFAGSLEAHMKNCPRKDHPGPRRGKCPDKDTEHGTL